LFWVASAWFTLRLYILCTLLEASSVDENPLFEQVQDITKVVVRPRCTWAFFQVVNPHSHGPMKVGPHGTWDHMGPHEDAHFLCLDGAVALATTSKLAVYRFQLHLQVLEEGWKCTEFER